MSKEFLYALNAMENAAQAENPAQQNYRAKRERVLAMYAELEATLQTAQVARDQLQKQLASFNTPEIEDFVEGTVREAKYQRQRWGSEHDAGKQPQDWFWLIGYLAGKCLQAQLAGDRNKALHHSISTAAACLNWHAAMLSYTNMRPGHARTIEQEYDYDPGMVYGNPSER